MTSARTLVLPDWIGSALGRVPKALRVVGLVLAVGTLIEFLPLDLAVVAVLVASMHLSMVAGMVWSRLRGWLGRWLHR